MSPKQVVRETRDDPERVARGLRMREARLTYAAALKRTISQAAMAEAIAGALGRALSQSAWSDYEIGDTDPPYDVLAAAAKLSGLTREYLAWGPPPVADGREGESDSRVGESSHNDVSAFPLRPVNPAAEGVGRDGTKAAKGK